jgi:hypothetical protein
LRNVRPSAETSELTLLMKGKEIAFKLETFENLTFRKRDRWIRTEA